jgi:U3 small nucleolar RNA-associated protein 19
MDFVKLGKDGKFQSAIYHKFLYAVVSISYLMSLHQCDF